MPRAKTAIKKVKKSKVKHPTKRKAKAKKKIAAKSKSSAKHKTSAKTKSHTKAKAPLHKKRPTKRISRKRPSHVEFSDDETDILLEMVEKIVNLHKRKQEGLKSFYSIDRILDKFNQHYPHPVEKLAAIIRYGMEKDPAVTHEHFYVVMNNREKDENDLYQLLSGIGKGEVRFEEAKEKMSKIYEQSIRKK